MSRTKKFNIVDILIVVIVLIFIAGLGIRIFGKTAKNVKHETDITYTVEVKNIRNFTVDALKKASTITDMEGEKVIGEIVSIKEIPYSTESHYSDGTAQLTEIPERYTCEVVIKSPAKYANNTYNLAEGIDVSVGGSFAITTKYVRTTGTVMELSKEVVEKN